MLHVYNYTLDFFEECIKEEQFEAKKLDIMRDAVRAKTTYNVETRKIDSDGANLSDHNELSSNQLLPHENGNETAKDIAVHVNNDEKTGLTVM